MLAAMNATSVFEAADSAACELPPPDPATYRSPVPPVSTPESAGVVRQPARGIRRLLHPATLLAAVGVGVVLAFEPVAIALVVVLFVLIVPFEKVFPRHRQRVRREAVGTDIAYALVSTPMGAVSVAVGVVMAMVTFAWLPGLLLRPLVMLIPELPRLLLGLLLFDLAIYWAHRWSHEVPFLWRFHSVHHSTRHLDWVSGFRNHPVDGAIIAPVFVLLLVAGFSPEFTGALAVVQFVTGLFAHANVRFRWRPLHKVVFTPEFHHWHHADEPEAINTNYSVFLPAWDLLFGTYYMPADKRPQVYGISEPMPSGLMRQLWHPFRGLRNPLTIARHPVRAMRELPGLVRRGMGELVRTSRRRTA